MTNQGRTLIGFYYKARSGNWELKESCDLEDIGAVPNIGDFITDPGVEQGKDRSIAANRSVWEVVGRYFLPRQQEGQDVRIALALEERPGRDDEMNILGD